METTYFGHRIRIHPINSNGSRPYFRYRETPLVFTMDGGLVLEGEIDSDDRLHRTLSAANQISVSKMLKVGRHIDTSKYFRLDNESLIPIIIAKN